MSMGLGQPASSRLTTGLLTSGGMICCDQLHCPAPYPESELCSLGPHCALCQGPPQAPAVCGVWRVCRERRLRQLHLTCDQLHCPAPYPESEMCSLGLHCGLFQGPPHWILLAAYNMPLQFVESGAFVVSTRNANCTSLVTSCIVQNHIQNMMCVL
jgi:hypothetical protein